MPDPIFDARPTLGGAPGVHALVIGIGRYPYLKGGGQEAAEHWDMDQLSSTASSTYKIYEWLVGADSEKRLPLPLATCRLLLSPVPDEAHLIGCGEAANLANFSRAANEWREDLKGNRENIAFFYFAGHGVQRTTEDAVLCLEEFRHPGLGALVHSVSLANIRGGMAPAPGFEDIGRTQFYFIDACRVRPDKFSEFEKMGTTDVFDVALAGKDDRSSPVFYAAISNSAAIALPGRQTLFSRAVLDCLNGEAAEALSEDAHGVAEWGVTIDSLNEQLDGLKIEQLNREFQADQTYAPGGQFRPRRICRLLGPPPVRFRLELIPSEASQFGTVTIRQAPNGPVHGPLAIHPHPYTHQLPGGYYTVEITFNPPHPSFQATQRNCYLKPVEFSKQVKVN